MRVSPSKNPSTRGKKNLVRKRGRIGSSIRRWSLISAAGIVLVFGILGLFGKNGVLDMVKLKYLHQSLQKENLSLLETQEELKSEIARLHDGRYVEYLARERLGLMHPNEVFIILDIP